MPFSFINWEESCTCRSSCRSTCMISPFIVRALSKSRVFIHTYMRNMQSVQCAHWVLVQFVYALLAGHKRYLWRASVQSETSFYREYVRMIDHTGGCSGQVVPFPTHHCWLGSILHTAVSKFGCYIAISLKQYHKIW